MGIALHSQAGDGAKGKYFGACDKLINGTREPKSINAKSPPTEAGFAYSMWRFYL
jgi:hypothetical protein